MTYVSVGVDVLLRMLRVLCRPAISSPRYFVPHRWSSRRIDGISGPVQGELAMDRHRLTFVFSFLFFSSRAAADESTSVKCM